jgi:tRNA G18 (ribose-2'-O)-methylase SpoU
MNTQRDRTWLTRYRKERQKNVLAQPGPHEFVLVLDQLKAGFNVPKIFRSAEAFGASAVHLINIGPFDPSPAKGSFRKVPAVFHEDFAACYRQLKEQDYHFFQFHADAETALHAIDLPARSAFVFGHEEFGCSFNQNAYPDIKPLVIPQFGSVHCLNVSAAATIAMYEYVRQYSRCADQGV